MLFCPPINGAKTKHHFWQRAISALSPKNYAQCQHLHGDIIYNLAFLLILFFLGKISLYIILQSALHIIMSGSTPTATKNNHQPTSTSGDQDGLGRWLFDLVFGRTESKSSPEEFPSSHPTNMVENSNHPSSSSQQNVKPPINTSSSARPPSRTTLQNSATPLLSRPPTTTVRELPPLTDLPPTPPPRRHHLSSSVPPPQALQRQQIYPRYQQRVNRVSAASTLVGADEFSSSDTDDVEQKAESKMHYGPAPSHTRRRYATHRIRLTHGNLVINCPVPDKLLSAVPRKDEEFSTMRYTAVTCEPDEFPHKNYALRQQRYNRHTELFIVITMYNVSPDVTCKN